MIQRIQTVYLALALIFLGLTGWMPLGEFVSGDIVYQFTLNGVSNTSNNEMVYNGWPLLVLSFIIAILQIITIFGYKKRIRQIRIAAYNLILMIGLVGAAWFFASKSMKGIGESVSAFKIALAFPVVSAILNFLAIRAIGKDEALVRSIDRIR
jgi:hypothetical protein